MKGLSISILNKLNRQELIDMGREEGINEVIEEGIGIKKGRYEAKVAIAQRLIEMGYSLDDVVCNRVVS